MPHLHVPPLQLFAKESEHGAQVIAPVPQLVVSGGETHVVPLQQPPGHELLSQTHDVPLQRWPSAHAGPAPQLQSPFVQTFALLASHTTQPAPPMPHVAGDGARQVAPSQQPAGQFVELHAPPTHIPAALHVWPLAQAAVSPHRHVPAIEQALASVPAALQFTHAAPFGPHAVTLAF